MPRVGWTTGTTLAAPPLAGRPEDGVAAVQVQPVTGAVGEVRGQREPVAADEGVPPLDGPVPRVAEPVDGQCAHRPGEPEQPLLGGAGHDRADVLVAARQAYPGPAGELVVQGGMGEVGLQQRRRQVGGQPDAVQRQRLVSREAEPFQVEQRGRRLQVQAVGHHPVGANVPGADDAPLAQAGLLHQREERIQRAERLGDQVVGGQPGPAATFGHDEALGPQVAERGPDRVTAHPVLPDQGELAGEVVVEGARVKPPPQVRMQLGPQRQRVTAVQPPRRQVGSATCSGHRPSCLRLFPSTNDRTFEPEGRPPGKDSRPWWKCSRSRRRRSATAATWCTTARPRWSSTRSGTSAGSPRWPMTRACGSPTSPRRTCTTTTSPGASRSPARPARLTWSMRTTRSPSTAPRSATATGGMRVRVLATPGHTFSHLAYVVEAGRGTAGGGAAGEGAAGGEMAGVFTGGSLLYGSTGRTDLLGPGSTQELSRAQWASARRLARELPGTTPVFPTHGFGSFCSATQSQAAASTIGHEKLVNPVLTLDERAYVASLLAGLDAWPAYYAHMATVNLAGPGEPDLSPPRPADAAELRRRIEAGEWVVDLRDRIAFAAGHVPGTFSIPMDNRFATYLGWMIPWGTPLTLLGDSPQQVAQAQLDLARIGIDQLAAAATGRPETWAGQRGVASLRLAKF